MTFQYLASPYSHEDPFIREERYLKALWAVDELLKSETVAYSPIVHFHECAKILNSSRTADFYRFHNLAMLKASSGLIILTLPYWGISEGVASEIDWAKELDKPIQLMAPEEGELTPCQNY